MGTQTLIIEDSVTELFYDLMAGTIHTLMHYDLDGRQKPSGHSTDFSSLDVYDYPSLDM